MQTRLHAMLYIYHLVETLQLVATREKLKIRMFGLWIYARVRVMERIYVERDTGTKVFALTSYYKPYSDFVQVSIAVQFGHHLLCSVVVLLA